LKKERAHLRLFGVGGRGGNALVTEHHVTDGQHHSDHHNGGADQVSEWAW